MWNGQILFKPVMFSSDSFGAQTQPERNFNV